MNGDAYLSDGGLFYLNRVRMRPAECPDALLRHITYTDEPETGCWLSINYSKYFQEQVLGGAT